MPRIPVKSNDTRKPVPLGVRAGLEPYQAPLDRRRAAHLLRRTSFLGTGSDVDAIVGRTADEVVDEMILAARIAPQPADPPWVNNVPPPRSAPSSTRQQYNRDNTGWVLDYRKAWMKEFLDESLRENMTLFWHDHFVTEIQTYRYAFFAHRYLKLLRTNCLQYFKTFVRQVGIDPSMLIYLNGNTNQLNRPNENYGRELLELFTMSPFNGVGEANYTEADIKEISRALTGWVISETTGGAQFVVERFDSEPKSVFGLEGSYGYDEVVDLIFEERTTAIARFIAEKLYRHFVFDVPDEAVVTALAARLEASDPVNHNYALFDAVGTLLKSAHFFDPATFGTKIKSPLEFLFQIVKTTGRENTEELYVQLVRLGRTLDQEILNPPIVAGWPKYHDWITTNSLPLRWAVGESLLFGGGGLTAANLIDMAAELHDPADPNAAFYLPTAIAEHFLAVELQTVDIPEVTDDFAGDLNAFPIPADVVNGPAYVRNLAKIFLSGAPWYDWYLYGPGANERLLAFVHHVIQYPDYQLT